MACCGKRRDSRDSDMGMMIEDPSVRRRFIVKVLMIVAINLLFTSLFAAIPVFHRPTRMFFRRHWWLFIPAICVLMTIHILVCYCQKLFRRSPIKFILLAVYVLAHTVLLCLVVSRYQPKLIFAAFGICTAMVILLGLFAKFAPCDFTGCWIFVFVISVILMLLGILTFFFRIMLIIYAAVGIFAYSLFLVIDLQLLIGGKTHKNEYDEEDYIIAALQIYTDIIEIFKMLLICLGLLEM
ncbi:protein lifeguard 3 [Drosophila kikkawai]|uniref:Protein lifeguard 3 n=1 Tax=Drosophila kikkawai TaxID=30033 RepID=A0A6P4I1V3_DROKI|nr:protein lifeguard 3 [Drosophila kikkawai]